MGKNIDIKLDKKYWHKLKRFQAEISPNVCELEFFVLTYLEEAENIILYLECDFLSPQFDSPESLRFIRVFAREDAGDLVSILNKFSKQADGLKNIKVLSLQDIGVNFNGG